jgi:myosin-crossreactive antigen
LAFLAERLSAMMNTNQGAVTRTNGKPQRAGRDNVKVYLVGGGIASLASAAYLIRDGGVPGENILIFEVRQ